MESRTTAACVPSLPCGLQAAIHIASNVGKAIRNSCFRACIGPALYRDSGFPVYGDTEQTGDEPRIRSAPNLPEALKLNTHSLDEPCVDLFSDQGFQFLTQPFPPLFGEGAECDGHIHHR